MTLAVTVERMANGPIIIPFMDRRMGSNVNGPSLIRTPPWLACRLGKYHLYFAHHIGSYIRLAYADHLEGPWYLYEPGVLDISQTPMFYEHIASPDVHVDEERRELRMYFHGVSTPQPLSEPLQTTALAHSFDGVTFAARPERLGESYFRVWQWRGAFYAMSLGGVLWRSEDGVTPFERGARADDLPLQTRHLAVLRKGEKLWVAWSVAGEAPERLYLGRIDLRQDWNQWRVDEAAELLRPEFEWEGAALECCASLPGLSWYPVNQLRDPAFYSEDGEDYLLYSVAGESGIAIARVTGLVN